MRVYELSKEIGVDNKEVIKIANKKYGLKLKSHTSAIEDKVASKIKESMLKNNESAPAVETEEKEQVKTFKNEAGQEVVERRKGSKVILRRKKKVADVPEPEPVPEDVKPEADQVAATSTGDEKLKEETPEIADLGSAPDDPANQLQDTADTEVQGPETSKETGPYEEGKKVEARTDKTAEDDKVVKNKKSRRAKISKEDVIDEETFEELRKAFKTKLPSRKKEYVIRDRARHFDRGRRDRGPQKVLDTQISADAQDDQSLLNKTGGQLSKEVEKKPITIGETVPVNELAKKMSIKGVELVKKLFHLGTPATINQTIDGDTAAIVAEEFGYKIIVKKFEEDDFLIDHSEEGKDKLEARPPVVTLMGHVDHGKTTLLDSIRQTKVVDVEAGGITQHIGAYKVTLDGRTIVFIDTPGHEAFTSMRSRGANITDIVILVVAADDGVMPQTVEAISHARVAEVPLIVAINKVDKENADIEKIKRQLSENDIVSEEWGGNTLFAEVSAKTKKGIDGLLELVLLQADVMELKAVADKRANGVVIETKLDKGRGPVSTVLVTEGTLRVGDIVTCGVFSGKVRALRDENGKNLKEAKPSVPVEIMGISGVPSAGERFYVVKDEKVAKDVIAHREERSRVRTQLPSDNISLEDLFSNMEENEVKELFLIVKADTHGSIEALKESINKLSNEKCKVNFVHSGVGGINESDIVLARASNAVVVGFNVRPDTKALRIAEYEGVCLELHSIIYDVLDRIKNAMEGLLKPIIQERIDGRAEAREIFHISRIGTIAGCMVSDGTVNRDNKVRILRESVVIYDGELRSLKRFKDDVREVQSGYECGISIENFNDIKVGDVFEFYHLEEIKQQL